MSSRRLLLLFFGFLALYAAGDWALPLVDRDEPRFAEASREMLERGDFIVPYFNNQVRFDKPPLIYWLQDASYKLFGENELAARLPSGLCGALTTVIIALWGAQLYDPRTGWRAAIIFGLCLQTILHAHASVADMAMIAASTASGWAGWNWLTATSPSTRMRWWTAFWALLAIGFLAKALVITHGAYAAVGLGKHVVMRSVAPLEGHGSKTWWSYAATFPFYFLTIWPSFFPWSIWLPPAVIALWRKRKEWSLGESYLVTGIVLIFGIFTLSRTKLPHYTLPAFPFMALLMAAWWNSQRETVFRRTAVAMTAGALALTLAGFPFGRRFFVSQRLFDVAGPSLTAPMQLATIDYHEPSLVWLFRSRIHGFDTPMNWKAADDWMRQPGPRVCVIPADQVRTTFRKMDPAWKVVTASGYDVANAHRLELSAIIKNIEKP